MLRLKIIYQYISSPILLEQGFVRLSQFKNKGVDIMVKNIKITIKTKEKEMKTSEIRKVYSAQ